jgi:nucleoside-diphosphate-sugar epimerase
MRVLLTGNRGYIGSVMAPILVAAGHDVVGLDSDLYRDGDFGGPPPPVPTLVKDVRDVTVDDLRGFEAVVHLAGLSNDPLGDLDAGLTEEINHRATVRLAALAKAAGVERFVFSSTCSVYGAGGEDALHERSPLRPLTAYARSKVEAEHGLSALADGHFSPTYLRNATAYGVSPRLRVDLVLNNLTAWAHTTGQVLLKSDGASWRPVAHIADIAQAFLAALNAPRAVVHDQAFNVVRSGENHRIRDLARIVAEVCPRARVTVGAGASPDARSYIVDNEKIRRVLGAFRPRWIARLGARQLLNAYQTHRMTREAFEGPRYRRVAHIRALLSAGALDETLRLRRPAHAAAQPHTHEGA